MSKCAVCGTEEVVVFTKAYCPREDDHPKSSPRYHTLQLTKEDIEASRDDAGVFFRFSATQWAKLPNYWGSVPRGLVSRGTHPDQCTHSEDLYLAPAGTGPGWFCYHCGTLLSSTVVAAEADIDDDSFLRYHSAWDEYLDHHAPFRN